MMALFAAFFATAVLFLLLSVILRKRVKERKAMVNRLNSYADTSNRWQKSQVVLGERKKVVTFRDQFRNLVRSLANVVRKMRSSGGIELKMQQADWPLLGSEFEVIAGIVGVILALILFLLTMEPIWLIVGFGLGVLLSFFYLEFSIKRRQKAFAGQLGDMLTMVSNALRAGFSFLQAFELIAKEMDAPIGREAERVVREINIGVSFEQAMENMQKRVGSKDFELVVTAVLIQRQVGGNLSQILDTISETIAERIRMRREVNALTAQGRMSGIVLALLPVALAGFLMVASPGYMDPLFENEMGRLLIGACFVMDFVGFMIIRKIVDIQV